jgi:predicted metal-dependent HD superfamily phosphohydrolase
MLHDHPARAWLAQDGLERLWDAAAVWYRMPKRHYHNLSHANAVTTSLFTMGVVSPALMLAARWHDAVYIPGAAVSVNEDASATALKLEARNLNLTLEQMDVVQEAETMIRLTSMDMHLSRILIKGAIATLLDADISGMASGYRTFIQNQKNIVLEQTGLPPTKEGLAKASAWLTGFASRRPYLFHTERGRFLYEVLAQDNIKRFAKTYGAK